MKAKRLGKVILGAAAVFVVAILALFALLQVESVKTFLAGKLAEAVSRPPGRRVEIGTLRGTLPFDFQLDRVAVGDAKGTWLEARGIALRWSPGALLRGRVVVEEVSAEQLTLERFPEGPAEPPPDSGKPAEIRLPGKLPPLVLEDFQIQRLSLGKAILGIPVELALQGKILPTDPEPGLRADLSILRADAGPPSRAFLSAAVLGAAPRLRLHAEVQEAPGGLIASLAGLEDAGALNVSLSGEGPLDRWEGEVEVGVGRFGTTAASIQVMLSANLLTDCRIQGTSRPEPSLIPEPWRPVSGTKLDFLLAARLEPGTQILLQDFSLEGAGFQLSAGGRYAFTSREVDVRFRLLAPDLALLETAAGFPVAGAFELTGSAKGTTDLPQGEAAVRLENGRLGGVRFDSLTTTVHARPRGPVGPGLSPVDVSATGGVSNLTKTDGSPLPEPDWRWEAAGSVAGEQLVVERFEVLGRVHRLTLTGRHGIDSGDTDLEAQVGIDDLSTLGAFLNLPLNGTARSVVTLKGNLKEGSAEGVLKLQSAFPKDLAPPLQPLEDSELLLSSSLRFQPGRRLIIDRLELESPPGQLDARATIDLSAKSLEAAWNLQLPELERFSGAVGTRLAGSLRGHGEVSGHFDSFQAVVDLSGQAIAVDRVALDTVEVSLDVAGLPRRVEGTAALQSERGGEPLHAASTFSFQDDTFELSSFTLEVPETRVDGNLTHDLKRRITRGNVSADSEDLRPLGRIVGQQIEGRGRLQARLYEENGKQDMELTLEGSGLEAFENRIESIRLEATFSDVTGHPQGTGTLHVTGLKAGDYTAESLTVNAEGHGDRLAFDGRFQGRILQELQWRTEGMLQLTKEDKTLTVDVLDGRFGRHRFELLSPVRLGLGGQGRLAGELALRLGSGTIEGQLDRRLDSARLDLRWEDLDLELLRLFGGPEMEGALSGQIRVSGNPSRPNARADLRAEGLRIPGPEWNALPDGTLDAHARLEGGSLELTANLMGLSPDPVDVTATLPVQFRLEPFMFTVSPRDPLSGRMAARLDLGRFAGILPLDDQRIGGRMDVDLSVAGTMENPTVRGTVSVDEGLYENYASGTVLKDLALEVRARDALLELTSLRTTDGASGTVTAEGSLQLDRSRSFPLSLEADIRQATLVRREEVTAAIDGTLSLEGTTREMTVRGALEARPVEIYLPKRLPPEVAELEVIEVGGAGEEPGAEAPTETPSPFRLVLDLDLNLPGQVYVRGWGLESEWEGRLRIRGTADQPSVTGTLSVARGTLNFLNKQFQLARSSLQFFGASPPAPVLDIRAESREKDLTAVLNIRGDIHSPELVLSSEPDLPQDEILARLLFGRGAAQISPLQALRLAQAARALSGYGAGGGPNLLGKTGRLLGLDQLGLRGSEEGMEGTKVGAGKYLTEEIYVDYEQGLAERSGKVTVEVEVHPNVTVETEVGTDAGTGIGVNWKLDY